MNTKLELTDVAYILHIEFINFQDSLIVIMVEKGKVIPVTGRGDP
jgi:hypothetical protein